MEIRNVQRTEWLLKTQYFEKQRRGNSLVVQWLGLRAFTAEGPGSIPDRGTKILQATQCSQKKRKKKENRQEGSGGKMARGFLPSTKRLFSE